MFTIPECGIVDVLLIDRLIELVRQDWLIEEIVYVNDR